MADVAIFDEGIFDTNVFDVGDSSPAQPKVVLDSILEVIDRVIIPTDPDRDHSGGNGLQSFVELTGNTPVPLLRVEPDPKTARARFYYNTTLNVLYSLVNNGREIFWKPISR